MPSQPAARNAVLEMINSFAAAVAASDAAARRRGDKSGDKGGGADTGGGGAHAAAGASLVGLFVGDDGFAATTGRGRDGDIDVGVGLGFGLPGNALQSIFAGLLSRFAEADDPEDAFEGMRHIGITHVSMYWKVRCYHEKALLWRCPRRNDPDDNFKRRKKRSKKRKKNRFRTLKGFGFLGGTGASASNIAEAAAARAFDAAVKIGDDDDGNFACTSVSRSHCGVYTSPLRGNISTAGEFELELVLDAGTPRTKDSMSNFVAASAAFVQCFRGDVVALTGVSGRDGVGEGAVRDLYGL